MKKFNMGRKIIQTIQSLYSRAKSAVFIQGTIGDWFHIRVAHKFCNIFGRSFSKCHKIDKNEVISSRLLASCSLNTVVSIPVFKGVYGWDFADFRVKSRNEFYLINEYLKVSSFRKIKNRNPKIFFSAPKMHFSDSKNEKTNKLVMPHPYAVFVLVCVSRNSGSTGHRTQYEHSG